MSLVSRRRRHPGPVSLALFDEPLEDIIKTITWFLAAIQLFPGFLGNPDVLVRFTCHTRTKKTQSNKELPTGLRLTKLTLVMVVTYLTPRCEWCDG